jgi:hypothetical protein
LLQSAGKAHAVQCKNMFRPKVLSTGFLKKIVNGNNSIRNQLDKPSLLVPKRKVFGGTKTVRFGRLFTASHPLVLSDNRILQPAFIVLFGIVDIVMKAAAFLPEACAFRNELCHRGDIPEFEEVRSDGKVPVVIVDL